MLPKGENGSWSMLPSGGELLLCLTDESDSTGPGLVHQLTSKDGDLACWSTMPNTNFLILLACFSPLWIMSLIPLESLVPFVLSLLFHQSKKESKNS